MNKKKYITNQFITLHYIHTTMNKINYIKPELSIETIDLETVIATSGSESVNISSNETVSGSGRSNAYRTSFGNWDGSEE